jgi:hypothetical protein
MNAGQLSGSLAWLAMGVGYAWVVLKLARMSRVAAPGEAHQHGNVRIVVDEPGAPHATQPVAAMVRNETDDVSGGAEAYRRA